ncbi:MAG TPA: AraC family transcriptional regulator [Thermoanaerobaculia bacterium]|nr:AraC family transcriptional regulator [Thermoanaerobaculia bacterium]
MPKNPRTFTGYHRQRLDRAAENYLDECYRTKQPARGKDFARSLDMTPEYMSWVGSRILGGSLHGFLREKQLAYAARLLRTTALSIEEIAVRSGFGTRSTLHRRFVARFEVTPAAFRELKK